MNYATLEDLEKVWRSMTESEQEKASTFIAEASAKIRLKAKSCGKDFDEIITTNEDMALVTKGIVCTIVKNAMNVPIDQEAMTQMSMAAGGYSWSGTYSVPGGGIKFTKADWKALGLGVQMYGGCDFYGIN